MSDHTDEGGFGQCPDCGRMHDKNGCLICAPGHPCPHTPEDIHKLVIESLDKVGVAASELVQNDALKYEDLAERSIEMLRATLTHMAALVLTFPPESKEAPLVQEKIDLLNDLRVFGSDPVERIVIHTTMAMEDMVLLEQRLIRLRELDCQKPCCADIRKARKTSTKHVH